ncbi:MAG: type IV secretory system conjugative DNA transfer family protein, partial [Bacilli bacterium]|nr:type IV secretory system conjugative DNA transfer family protein [Bacilli bacterium]
MKLKMRFETKDMIIFCIFAVILFLLVAIGVSNLVYLGKEGAFYGFNPSLALFGGYFVETVVFFIIALIVLIASCKDYFFEFDKGFGFTTEKKSDGFSRWASEKEIRKELKPINAIDQKTDAGGIVLINDGKKLWVDDGEYHNLIIGATGSGKTQTIIFPMVHTLSKHDESMIITDPKGEIYEKTSEMLRRKGYNIVLLNFRSPGQGNAWNPLTLPYLLWKEGNQDKAIELLDDLALNILYDESNKNADPFWEKTSADYFSGLALGLFEDATEEEININSISLMTTVGEDKFGGSTYIKEYFNTKDPTGAAYINASSTILAPSDTKGSIIAVFKQKIKLFASRVNLSEMLSYSDFSIQDIGLKKTAVFIVIQDEKKTYHSLATILVKQIYETLIDVAQSHGGKLPIRTNFLLDEFANMPPLKDVTTMITAARSRAMRFTLIIQNFAQLNEVYGEQNAETIKGNCGNMIYLI